MHGRDPFYSPDAPSEVQRILTSLGGRRMLKLLNARRGKNNTIIPPISPSQMKACFLHAYSLTEAPIVPLSLGVMQVEYTDAGTIQHSYYLAVKLLKKDESRSDKAFFRTHNMFRQVLKPENNHLPNEIFRIFFFPLTLTFDTICALFPLVSLPTHRLQPYRKSQKMPPVTRVGRKYNSASFNDSLHPLFLYALLQLEASTDQQMSLLSRLEPYQTREYEDAKNIFLMDKERLRVQLNQEVVKQHSEKGEASEDPAEILFHHPEARPSQSMHVGCQDIEEILMGLGGEKLLLILQERKAVLPAKPCYLRECFFRASAISDVFISTGIIQLEWQDEQGTTQTSHFFAIEKDEAMQEDKNDVLYLCHRGMYKFFLGDRAIRIHFLPILLTIATKQILFPSESMPDILIYKKNHRTPHAIIDLARRSIHAIYAPLNPAMLLALLQLESPPIQKKRQIRSERNATNPMTISPLLTRDYSEAEKQIPEARLAIEQGLRTVTESAESKPHKEEKRKKRKAYSVRSSEESYSGEETPSDDMRPARKAEQTFAETAVSPPASKTLRCSESPLRMHSIYTYTPPTLPDRLPMPHEMREAEEAGLVDILRLST